MNNIYNWIIGNMGNRGEYMYQSMHIITTLFVAGFIVLFCLIAASKINQQVKRKILVGVSIFCLVFEVLWRVLYIIFKNNTLIDTWPTYPCNLGGIIIPIIALTNNETFKKMFYLFGFVGGIITFALPEGIFCTDVFVFPILKSVLQHFGILVIPAFEYFNKSFRPSIRSFNYFTLGALIHLYNCEVIDKILGFNGDYMFLRSGYPFVIEGVPQPLTLLIFGYILFYLISFLCDIKDSVSFIKNSRFFLSKKVAFKH